VKLEFKDLAAHAALPLVRDGGFKTAGRRQYARDDGLLHRHLWFAPSSSLPGSFGFEVYLDLGLNGLSVFTRRVYTWVIRCHGNNLRDQSLPLIPFELTGEVEHDLQVRDAVAAICAFGYEHFLLRHKNAEELYAWIRAEALRSTEKPRPPGDLLWYSLSPANTIPALQLASVYAAFLGRAEESAELENAMTQYAMTNRMEDYMPRCRAEIMQARAQIAASHDHG
jgi:hypothetical protein